MKQRRKTSNRCITVRGIEYRWAATGDDGFISLTIKPSNRIGPVIETSFSYGDRNGSRPEWLTDQIVITNRIVNRVIDHALDHFEYDPMQKGKPLKIHRIEESIDMSDVIRVSDT